jgi:hypothetical protein
MDFRLIKIDEKTYDKRNFIILKTCYWIQYLNEDKRQTLQNNLDGRQHHPHD